MKAFPRSIAKFCPFASMLYSVSVVILTIYINEKATAIFIYCCAQVYLNWYSVYNTSQNATTMKARAMEKRLLIYQKPGNNTEHKYWYCEKCNNYTCKPTHHCTFCKKCFHYRDHHCFFLDACVLRQNIGNFILLCFYTSLTCIYSLCILGPYLYDNINRVRGTDADSFNIYLNFCFPIALVKLLHSRENSYILLVTMFDTLVSIFCICSVYAAWKLHSCLTGKQRYVNVSRKQSLKDIFGNYGLANVIFPYNGLIGTRDLNGEYELKEV